MPVTESPGNQPIPLCPDGGVPNNISWFAFIADDGDYTVTITPTGCFGSTTGQEGVQMGIYTDCTFSEPVYCDPTCNVNPLTFDSNSLTPGQIYYFFIDGCSASTCSYGIQVDGNPIPYFLDIEELCIFNNGNLICEDSEFCTGEEINFETDDQNGNAEYNWSITTISGGPYEGNQSPITEDNSIELTFNNMGVYSLCILSVDNGCVSWAGNLCRTVTIAEDAIVEVFDEISVCEGMISDFDVNLLNDQDPNGDGILGWIDTDFEFTFGNNTSIVDDPILCTSEQQIFIAQIDNPEISLNPNADSLCLGDTLTLGIAINGNYDNLVLTINSIIHTDSSVMLIPVVGEQNIIATISNACGTNSDEATIQVLDTISAPSVICDSSMVGSIVLSWPVIDDIVVYSLSINGDPAIELTESTYVIENLGSGEVLDIEFNLIAHDKCVGSPISFTCMAATVVGISEYSASDINIVPNPTSDYIIIDGDFNSSNATYRIYSTDGGLIKIGNLDDSRKIDVLDLSTGLYLITIDQNANGKKWVERFVKQ